MTKKKRSVNGKRSIEQEVYTDSHAKNLLSINTSGNYNNSKVSKPSVLPFLKQKRKRVYSEKELDIPKLNKAIDPEGIKKPKGKKGKVFADKTAMLRILNTVAEAQDSANASRLEKARQLEEIREAKRLEMERKEQEKEERLNRKKSELKKKRKTKNQKDSNEVHNQNASSKKRVSFA